MKARHVAEVPSSSCHLGQGESKYDEQSNFLRTNYQTTDHN